MPLSDLRSLTQCRADPEFLAITHERYACMRIYIYDGCYPHICAIRIIMCHLFICSHRSECHYNFNHAMNIFMLAYTFIQHNCCHIVAEA